MKRTIFALALAAALPMSAQASELSYSFVEVDYQNGSDAVNDIFSGNTVDSEGFGIRGSFGFAENFYATGAYGQSNLDVGSPDIDYDKWSLGFGYHRPMYDQADWFVEAAYSEINADIFFLDDSFYRVSAGIRGSITDRFEGTAKLSYNDGADFDGAFYPQYDGTISASVGMQWRLNEMWGIVGEIEAYDKATDYTIGVRASF